jgi:Spy/CpxP family protein refolding chaperone
MKAKKMMMIGTVLALAANLAMADPVADLTVDQAPGAMAAQGPGAMMDAGPAMKHQGNFVTPKMINKFSRLALKLNLTAQQRDVLRKKMTALMPQTQQYQEQMVDSIQNLAKLATEDNPDKAQIKKYADLQGDALSHMIQLRLEKKQSLFSVLTPEQKVTFQTIMQKKMKHKGKGMRGPQKGPHGQSFDQRGARLGSAPDNQIS